MRSVTFAMGSGPGQKPAGDKINDTAFINSVVHFLIVNDVPNNTTFIHDPLTGDIKSGNSAQFLEGKVTVVYTPCTTIC